ncbi:LPS export ABC transporter periplasmic protein LptC [Sphingomonas sp. CFBP 8760]|uniref:LPS export ABC transporter periplasmic protein LptC n=1 Tax=Sphingomonas sp. CFBP 8760 TaxID=2775282 RepID=UPI0017820912|nr:LPS export ABC transporter periplasmic protein LptC [Sphingomonas sp. CFBP 8760]MBD8547714.1 LPS export ABC transporter periplasmic protein LptC [Sphingomonas sp. CFBP 8760]
MPDPSRQRTAREEWAAPGSRHDRLVAVMRVALPTGIGILSAFLVMAPLTAVGDVSFVLDKKKVEVAHERMKIQSARYRGQDTKGQPFELDAGSAIQRSSAEPVVQLRDLSAGIQLTDGPARVVAGQGHYDMDTQRVTLEGPIAVRAAGGYRLDTSNATVDLESRRMQSAGAVTGTVPQGTFRGDRMRADLEARTVTLDGNARLRFVPRGAK